MRGLDIGRGGRGLLGLSIAALLFYFIGFGKIAESLLSFDALYLIPVTALFIAEVLAGGLNLKLLFGARRKLETKGFFLDYLSSWGLGFIAPGKIGDFSLAYFLRNQMPAAESGAIILLDKIITLFVLTMFGSVSLVLFLGQGAAAGFIAALLFLWAAGIAIILTKPGIKLLSRVSPEKYRAGIDGFSRTLGDFLAFEKRRIFLNLSLTIVKLGIQALAFVLIFSGLGVKSGFLEIFLITCASTIMSFVPLTSGGLGIKEGTFAFLALQAGIPLEKSVANAVVSTAINYTLMAAAIGLLSGRALKDFAKK